MLCDRVCVHVLVERQREREGEGERCLVFIFGRVQRYKLHRYMVHRVSKHAQTYLLVILLARGHRSHRYMYARMKYDMKSLLRVRRSRGVSRVKRAKRHGLTATGYRYFQTCLARNLARHNDIPDSGKGLGLDTNSANKLSEITYISY